MIFQHGCIVGDLQLREDDVLGKVVNSGHNMLLTPFPRSLSKNGLAFLLFRWLFFHYTEVQGVLVRFVNEIHEGA